MANLLAATPKLRAMRDVDAVVRALLSEMASIRKQGITAHETIAREARFNVEETLMPDGTTARFRVIGATLRMQHVADNANAFPPTVRLVLSSGKRSRTRYVVEGLTGLHKGNPNEPASGDDDDDGG